jgi:hypothetical protein
MKRWQIYLREAKAQAEFAIRCYKAFQEAERVSAVTDFFFHLHHFLVHATISIEFSTRSPGRIVTPY